MPKTFKKCPGHQFHAIFDEYTICQFAKFKSLFLTIGTHVYLIYVGVYYGYVSLAHLREAHMFNKNPFHIGQANFFHYSHYL